MLFPFSASCRALLRPGEAFAPAPPSLARACWEMARVWMPLALLNALGTAWRMGQAYELLRRGAVATGLFERFGVDPSDLRAALASLPPAPAFGRIWPWLLLAVPLGVLGTWLHHAVWDHLGLWLLGGLKRKRGFRTSLLAEAQALRVAALGTLLGLLGFVPVFGTLLALPLLLLDAYLWVFRGFALAARHDCEPWRGLAATVVHAVLVSVCGLGLLGLTLFVARLAV
ncbi:hypothetical protein GETHLI_15680 [Geothrix limicola]|uniref:Yip1 domain-containing protein n=1 Tax=Geothrix limicola TaxID=2927978 RepID=A0ABQ5QEY6_9BACT|nr:hypothetical protein [Geothrix limicola]GLH73066.1 hypothetical protein GETHLI_15680 [Geothrix limicola]